MAWAVQRGPADTLGFSFLIIPLFILACLMSDGILGDGNVVTRRLWQRGDQLVWVDRRRAATETVTRIFTRNFHSRFRQSRVGY